MKTFFDAVFMLLLPGGFVAIVAGMLYVMVRSWKRKEEEEKNKKS